MLKQRLFLICKHACPINDYNNGIFVLFKFFGIIDNILIHWLVCLFFNVSDFIFTASQIIRFNRSACFYFIPIFLWNHRGMIYNIIQKT